MGCHIHYRSEFPGWVQLPRFPCINWRFLRAVRGGAMYFASPVPLGTLLRSPDIPIQSSQSPWAATGYPIATTNHTSGPRGEISGTVNSYSANTSSIGVDGAAVVVSSSDQPTRGPVVGGRTSTATTDSCLRSTAAAARTRCRTSTVQVIAAGTHLRSRR